MPSRPNNISHNVQIQVEILRKYGFTSATFELGDDDVFQNILCSSGFAYGLALTLRLFRTATLQQSKSVSKNQTLEQN